MTFLFVYEISRESGTAERICAKFTGKTCLVHHLDDFECQGQRSRSPWTKIVENVAAHCEVMGHSTVTCGKTPQPIDMPFWMKTWVGPRNHTLDGVQIPQGEGAVLELSSPLTMRCNA